VSIGPGVVADAQRIFLSVREGTTDVVTEVSVPATTARYGVLIPLPAEPTLDTEPVPSEELDRLDAITAPAIYESTAAESNDGGCGCADAGGMSKSGGGMGGNVVARPFVDIGPVAAAVLTGEGAAISEYLAGEGFLLPDGGQALVDEYSGVGRYFVAIRRSDSAPSDAPSAVGVHFTLPGDQRGIPLRFARLGAAERVAFTLFVAAPRAVGPSVPFEALTLDDLPDDLLRSGAYTDAVAKAVAKRSGKALVIEGTFEQTAVRESVPRLSALIDPSRTLTRLTTVIAKDALDADVALDQPAPTVVPTERWVSGPRSEGTALATAGGFAALAFGRRRRRRER